MAKRDRLTVRLHLDRELFLAPLRELFDLLRMPDEPPRPAPRPGRVQPVAIEQPAINEVQAAVDGETSPVPGDDAAAERDPYERIADRAEMLELE